MSNKMFQVAFVILLMGILMVSWAVFYAIQGHQEDSDWVEHGELVRIQIEELSNYPTQLSSEIRRAVLMRDSIDIKIDSFKLAYQGEYQNLDSLTLNDNGQKSRLRELDSFIENHFVICEKIEREFSTGPLLTGSMNQLIEEESAALDSIMQKTSHMIRMEQQVLLGRLRDQQESSTKIPYSLIILTVSTLLAIGFLYSRAVNLQDRNKKANDELEEKVKDLESEINQRKNLETKLLGKQQELVEINAQLEQFAYIASHDLQEPLRKVRTFGSRLQDKFSEKLGEQGTDYISRMQNASERMQVLIDDLLKFSRVSRLNHDFKTVDLNSILKDVMGDLEVEIEGKEAKIKIDKLPTIQGDAAQMRQLFQNLISNSLKYSKSDVHLILNISVSEMLYSNSEEESKPFWLISIKDNGIGFDPQYKDQIFVIFKRLHGKSEYSGTGIGLAICEKIVHGHGGVISAESAVNEGATFNIYLPKE